MSVYCGRQTGNAEYGKGNAVKLARSKSTGTETETKKADPSLDVRFTRRLRRTVSREKPPMLGVAQSLRRNDSKGLPIPL
jgi:hypothetical protein